MLTVPQEIKDLLHQDHCQKNIRIHFPNAQRADICNDLIVKDSVQFTESICSQDSIKFGICESPIFECETVGVGNIKGATIEVFCEIYCNPLTSGAVFRTDIQAWVYPLPYGIFKVDSCQRQADMVHRRIVAYRYMQPSDIKYDISLIRLFQTSWVDSSTLYFRDFLIEYMLFNPNVSHSDLPVTNAHDQYGFSEGGVSVQFDTTNGKYARCYMGYGDEWGTTTSVDTEYYYLIRSDVKIKDGFDFGKYLLDCKTFSDNVVNALKSLGCSDDFVNKIKRYTLPSISYYNDKAFKTCEVLTGSTNKRSVIYDQNRKLIIKEIKDKEPFKYFGYVFNKYLSTSGSYTIGAVANDGAILLAPLNGFKINISATGYFQSFTMSCSTSDCDDIFAGTRYVGMSVNNITNSDYIALPRIISKSVQREKYSFETGTTTTVSRTEYLPEGDLSSISIDDFLIACIEKKGMICRFDRSGKWEQIDIAQMFSLTPSDGLYPSGELTPQGVTGGSILPEDYQSCWYDDEYTKPYGLVQCIYTDTNNNQILSQLFFNGFTEADSESDYKTYDISDNYLIRTNLYTQEHIDTILETIAGKLKNVRFMPVDLTGRGLPYVEAGDTFEILTRSNDSITTIILHRTLSGEQTLTDNYKSV